MCVQKHKLTKSLSQMADMIGHRCPQRVVRLHPDIQVHKIGEGKAEVDGGIVVCRGRTAANRIMFCFF